ncbi:MAG: HD domain-containing phosphohydrolase, partial [Chloroflexota bacterium]
DRYRDLVEHIHDLIGTHDLQGNILSINPAASKLLGMNHETIQKMNLRDLLIPEVRDQFEDYLAAIQKNGQASGLMYVQTANGGRRIWEYDNTLRLDSADGPIVRALARDVTERLQAENALRESEARYRDIFDGVQEAIFVESPDGRILEANQSACKIYGYTRAEFLAMNVTALVPEDYAVLTTEIGQISGPMETVNRRANGEVFPVEISGRVETINGEATLLVVVRDITERKQAEEKINLQLQRLSALKEIDRAISSNMDLHVSLDILLNQVLSQLGVDAASVLLLNTSDSLLEFAAGKGYRTPAIRQSRMRLGEGCAGQVGLERRVIHVPDLSLAGEQNQRAVLLKDEGFMQYFGVPLVAKGQLKGVLEVFQRSPLQPEAEWMHYLETLGGQAAIAIENAQMFEGLQQSNLELVTAYDATIAGWSHAMDLRDKETEGHTQRVTELTVQLAERMGLGARQVVHIRRGALLHDIGKLGVPDSILLKAGKLTDEEWAIMRRHPALAYEMLSPIAYLKPALDIPYCHHEKWDGTGYPRGLKGEEIPLAARIFAVVDVWDAVTSDRPYRAAWSKEKAFDYIRAESGKHFDPEVVEAFLGKFEQG